MNAFAFFALLLHMCTYTCMHRSSYIHYMTCWPDRHLLALRQGSPLRFELPQLTLNFTALFSLLFCLNLCLCDCRLG